jgi:hypothetical protein
MLKVMPAKMQRVDRAVVEKSFEFELQDHNPDTKAPAVRGRIELDKDGQYLILRFEGFGDKTSEDGYGAPVLVENWGGKLRVIAWADINQEDPTHTIDLSGAKEDSRQVWESTK